MFLNSRATILMGKNESEVDAIFRSMMNQIIDFGVSSEGHKVRPKWDDGTPAHTIMAPCTVVNVYDLSKEFPALQLRPVNLKKAVDEILWIFQKKSNNINDLNSKIWDQWADENGSIGLSYGYQVGKVNGTGKDQMDNVLHLLENDPLNRRIMTSFWDYDDVTEKALQECCWAMTYNVVDGKLNAVLDQRSWDTFVAGGWNISQYAWLQCALAHVSGLKVGELTHVIPNAHIYDRHIDMVKEMLERPNGKPVQLKINPEVTDFYDFTVDDFELVGYEPQKQIKGIPVAV